MPTAFDVESVGFSGFDAGKCGDIPAIESEPTAEIAARL
jgi:hypothetical protein